MKRFLPRLALTAALLAGALVGAPSFAFAGSLPGVINGDVTVMHTNDIHGSYKYSYNAGTVGFDGLAVLYSAQSNAPDFLLDAGDTFHGQSFATMSEGKSIAELMDTFYADGYDATTPGNHDWSYGADKLRTMTGYSTTNSPFAMLCANATSSNGVWSASILKTLNRTWKDNEGASTFNYQIKVGVVGAMDESLGESLRKDLVDGTSFSSAAVTINAEAKRLREDQGCNVVVCIAHTLNAKTFAAQLKGVDALIAGHEHINLDENVTGADGKPVRIVEAGSAFAEVGLLSIPYEYDTKGTEATDDDEITVPAADSIEKLYTAKDVNDLLDDPNKGSDYQSCLEGVRNKIKPLDEAFENESNKVLGTSAANYFYGEDAYGTHGWEMVRTTDFRPSNPGETTKAQTIGHVICASYLDLKGADLETGADLAIENAGGIRGGITAGDVTAGNVIAISPYGNTVETWTMTGADFLAALEHSLEISNKCNDIYELQQAYVAEGHTEQEAQDEYKMPNDSGSVLSFGGINVTIDWTQPEGKRIVSATLTKDGTALNPAKTYTVATNNYIITNTTDFPTFANATKHTEWGTCEAALRALIGQNDWESKMASLAGTISFGSAAVDPAPTPVPTPEPSSKTTTTVITKKTNGKLAATGDRTLAVVGACLIGGIVIIILGIIWKRRR